MFFWLRWKEFAISKANQCWSSMMSKSTHPEKADGYELGVSSDATTPVQTAFAKVKFIKNDSTGSIDKNLLDY